MEPNMTTTKTLSERYKADRVKMTEELKAIVQANKATVTEELHTSDGVLMRVTGTGGLSTFVELEQRNPCGADHYMLSWFMDHTSDNRLTDDFPGEVNKHHRRKATTLVVGFDGLKAKLAEGLRKAANGTAFLNPVAA